MNILLVDDEPQVLKQMKKIVSAAVPDSNIWTAGNGKKAVELVEEVYPEVVFLDIMMPGQNGLEVAKAVQSVNPLTNIIMVTAHGEYALDALDLFVSGFILKPADEEGIRRMMANLRHPAAAVHKGLYVRCFGNFEVFKDGVPIRFERSRSKEVFAYLVDRCGAAVSVSQICAAIWEDTQGKSSSYCRKLLRNLYKRFEELGYSEVLSFDRNSYAVLTDKLPCDYYKMLRSDHPRKHVSEYMNQYSWAEYTAGSLSEPS